MLFIFLEKQAPADCDHTKNRKECCNESCRRAVYTETHNKSKKYLEFDFCRDIKCKLLNGKKCGAKLKECPYTAKQMQKWFTKNNYTIKKKRDK